MPALHRRDVAREEHDVRERHHDTGRERDAPKEALREHGRVSRTRWALHDAFVRRIDTEALAGWAVHEDVDEEDLHGVQGEVQLQERAERDEDESRDARAELERDKVLDVVKDALALAHGAHDRRKVVVDQNHIGGLLRHIRA